MQTDRTTKILLFLIAIALWGLLLKPLVQPGPVVWPTMYLTYPDHQDNRDEDRRIAWQVGEGRLPGWHQGRLSTGEFWLLDAEGGTSDKPVKRK